MAIAAVHQQIIFVIINSEKEGDKQTRMLLKTTKNGH